MSLEGFFSPMNVSASGLTAERMRMDIVAQNIANSEVTQTENGQPYRRKDVVFKAALDGSLRHFGQNDLHGVKVDRVSQDQKPFKEVYKPGHPDANDDGYVLMPNVDIAFEMVDMMTASRTYEANLSAMKAFREMTDRTLNILR